MHRTLLEDPVKVMFLMAVVFMVLKPLRYLKLEYRNMMMIIIVKVDLFCFCRIC